MPYYVVLAYDAPGKAALREETRPKHRQRLREHDFPVTVHIGGPLLDDRDSMCGTMLVIEADTLQSVELFIADDPYSHAGVYDHVSIQAFDWGLGQPKD